MFDRLLLSFTKYETASFMKDFSILLGQLEYKLVVRINVVLIIELDEKNNFEPYNPIALLELQ